MSKKVYVLGAGSSIAHSHDQFPSINSFFAVAQKEGLFNNDNYYQIREYIKRVLGKNIQERNIKVDIEDLLTHIEIEIERTNRPELISIRQELLSLIRILLIRLSERISKNNGDYNKFIVEVTDSDTIITFNWDIVLDDLLYRKQILEDYEKRKRTKDGHYSDFIYNLTARGEGTFDYLLPKCPYSIWDPAKGYFIKAHGSVDWFYCNNESCRAYRKVYPMLDLENELSCSCCHEKVDYMIIPPILNKAYRKYPLIRTLWNLASKELSIADEIVVWGYSLPPTDFYATWLLRQARQQPLAKLTIINPEVINIQKRGNITLGITFIKRFYDLYRDVMPKESILLYKNYKDYIDGQDIFNKYLKGKSVSDYRFL